MTSTGFYEAMRDDLNLPASKQARGVYEVYADLTVIRATSIIRALPVTPFEAKGWGAFCDQGGHD
jgi:hypothetical protein